MFSPACLAAGEIEFQSYPIDSGLEADPELEAYLRPHREAVEAFSAEVVGHAAETLSRSRPECGLGNFVADALRSVGAEEFDRPVDFAFTNYGGLRRDVPPGPITVGMLTEVSPFQNYMAWLEIDGALAMELARAAARGGVAVSGLQVTADADGKLVEARVGGRPLDPERRYTVATIDYLVSTWSDLFREDLIYDKRISERLIQRDAMVLHLSRLQERGVQLRDAGDGRIKVQQL